MSRRKGTPCACDCASNCADPCGNKVRKINGVPPDSNGNFIVEAGNGIGISQGENKITIINQSMASSFVAGDNIEINPSGDDLEIRLIDNPVINGDLQVNGDIIQQGAAYETHAEKVYTTNDYIYMRDGAIAGLGAGDFSGFQVKKYDGTNDGRLVIDNSGVARVGDVGDEQPLLTRSESGSLTNDHLLKWDGTNQKAIDSGISASNVGIPNAVSINNYGPIVVAAGTQTDLASYTIPQNGTYLIIGVIASTTVMNTGARFSGFTINGSVNWMDVFGAVAGQGVNGTFATVNTLSAGDILKEIIYTTAENIQASGRFVIVRLI